MPGLCSNWAFFRVRCIAVATSSWFDGLVLCNILISCALLALEHPQADPTSSLTRALGPANAVVTALFVIECAVKVGRRRGTRRGGEWMTEG